jgi:hypothetical protein
MPCSRTGIVATVALALLVAVTTFAPRGGAGDARDRAAVQRRADAICGRAIRTTSRLTRPRNRKQSIAFGQELARVLRSTASELRSVGSGELAWAHQRWAAAVDDVRQALRRERGSAKAGATELVARREASAAAQTLGAEDCVWLARRA